LAGKFIFIGNPRPSSHW